MKINELKWYEFNQNNSGGSFSVDDQVTHRVFIEAGSKHDATEKALELGIYFDGVEDGIDCACCGDRWYGCHEVSFPYKYGGRVFDSLSDYVNTLTADYGWIKSDRGPDARAFHLDGKVTEWFYKCGSDGERTVWDAVR